MNQYKFSKLMKVENMRLFVNAAVYTSDQQESIGQFYVVGSVIAPERDFNSCWISD